ncbi:Mob1 family protein [Cordyceps fumosorosea ARSEF 2679]|uniref:Mob1 family protein n=1 Tax=Cordyceps fumosorosea (strain ARSEF 2679) TaxID=1081104 RepID=A0A167UDK2_CORFA|nr:Mob1 family protein [Cordyceps fumosorosea ARSEF 2679]OAA61480.1 Mob1 family protein [Cordyceps fumosorosea ARSEF 2679]
MALAPSSPRLPSPPPAAEIQMTPNSPSSGAVVTLEATQMEQSLLDANSKRRIHPGTKAADMAAGPPLVPLSELESAFSLQEHLAALHYNLTEQGTRALTRATAHQIAQPPTGIDRTLWLYELCRFLISQCNTLIVGFLFDTPPCSAATCPEMRASEWQFLCAVHEQPKSCCAIDYCCHTLDWAANVVSDQNIFPSRFVILNDTQSKNVGLKNLVNVFRRLHRIFAHAWFQHRSVFWAVEGQSGLYVFFKTVCDLYDLLPAENYKLPPEAEGLEASDIGLDKASNKSSSATAPPRPYSRILKPSSQPQQNTSGATTSEDNLQPHGRTTTRRHVRSSPSTGSAVMTVMETDEEETDAVTRELDNMHLGFSSPPKLSGFSDEPEAAEVPAAKEAVDGRPLARSTETHKADDKPEEPEKTGATKAATEETEVEPAVAEKSANHAEPAERPPATTAAPDTASPTDPPSAEAQTKEPAAESADTTSADRDGPAAAGQDIEAANEAADPSSAGGGGGEGTATTETPATTAADSPSATEEVAAKEDDQKAAV